MTYLSEYPDVLTARHIATIMNVGYTKALNIIKYTPELPHIKIGNTYRVSKCLFEKWLTTDTTRELKFD